MENYKAGGKASKYFLEAYQGLSFRHGGTGNIDVETILAKEGFQPIRLPDRPSIFLYLKRWLALQEIVCQVKTGDIVFCQFPVYPRMYRLVISKLHQKGARLVALLADIDGLKDQDLGLLRREIRQYALFRQFIVHNQAMEDWLRSALSQVHIVQLGPFDFLAKPNFSVRTLGNGINFSGNLAKSAFLKDLGNLIPLQFHIYGEGLDAMFNWPENLHYHGISSPYELPAKIKGSFGLVWDGDSIHGAKGSIGHYMAFINHHKLSLYILSGMPVIAPAFAGSAAYILEKGIGWVVNDLNEIKALLAKITATEYQAAREKMAPIALEISQGNHLRDALQKLLSS